MAGSPTIPHLAEAWSLGQFLAADRAAAEDLVTRAFADTRLPDRGRFAILRAVVRASGVAVGAVVPGLREEPSGPLAEYVDTSGANFIPLIGARAGSTIRDRLLPTVLGSLDPRDRLVCWLLASGISSPPDAAGILDTTRGQAETWLSEAERTVRRRLEQAAALHERPLLAAADNTDPLRDALRRAVAGLAEPVPATLVRRLRPSSVRVPSGRTPHQAPTRRILLIIAMIATMAVIGYALQSLGTESRQPTGTTVDAIRGAMDGARDLDPDFRTASPEQAELFIRDRLGWNVVVPAVRGRPVTGVGVTRLGPGLEVPVLFYGGPSEDPLRIVAYTYAFLDRAGPRMTLDADTRRQIAEPGRFSVLDTGDEKALVFRNRDDIFIAVTTGDAAALEDAIRFPG